MEIEYAYTYSLATGLKVEGMTNPNKVSDSYPEFYATNAADDSVAYYQLQVATSTSNFDSFTVWDSDYQSMATTTSGNICQSITYGESNGIAFDGSTYYWRIKFWDESGMPGDWSTATSSFTMADSVRLEFP